MPKSNRFWNISDGDKIPLGAEQLTHFVDCASRRKARGEHPKGCTCNCSEKIRTAQQWNNAGRQVYKGCRGVQTKVYNRSDSGVFSPEYTSTFDRPMYGYVFCQCMTRPKGYHGQEFSHEVSDRTLEEEMYVKTRKRSRKSTTKSTTKSTPKSTPKPTTKEPFFWPADTGSYRWNTDFSIDDGPGSMVHSIIETLDKSIRKPHVIARGIGLLEFPNSLNTVAWNTTYGVNEHARIDWSMLPNMNNTLRVVPVTMAKSWMNTMTVRGENACDTTCYSPSCKERWFVGPMWAWTCWLGGFEERLQKLDAEGSGGTFKLNVSKNNVLDFFHNGARYTIDDVVIARFVRAE
jgi:hypothetical protein